MTISVLQQKVAMVWACAAKDNDWVKKCIEYEVEGSIPRGRQEDVQKVKHIN